MKNYIKHYILLISIVFVSCEEVVDIDVPTAEPRLVVEASINWENGTVGNVQTIKLSLSTPYFDNDQINPVTGAVVKVKNNSNEDAFIFADQNDGTYTTAAFEPYVNQEYTLEIIYNNETYTAVETLMPVVDIEAVYQSKDQGFDKDSYEVNIVFTDPPEIENYYLIKYQLEGSQLPDLFDYSDEFTDGNQIELFYENEDIVPGDTIDIGLYGISKQYFNYIRLLIEQSSEGGPFATIPAQLKGNCLNSTNPDNYAFGYFRLTQVSSVSYTFVEEAN